jgi:hypothetical protein
LTAEFLVDKTHFEPKRDLKIIAPPPPPLLDVADEQGNQGSYDRRRRKGTMGNAEQDDSPMDFAQMMNRSHVEYKLVSPLSPLPFQSTESWAL